jgi:hypothetical protein
VQSAVFPATIPDSATDFLGRNPEGDSLTKFSLLLKVC